MRIRYRKTIFLGEAFVSADRENVFDGPTCLDAAIVAQGNSAPRFRNRPICSTPSGGGAGFVPKRNAAYPNTAARPTVGCLCGYSPETEKKQD